METYHAVQKCRTKYAALERELMKILLRLAQNVLRKNPGRVSEFCMCNGDAWFTNNDGPRVYDLRGMAALDKFLNEWDRTFQLCWNHGTLTLTNSTFNFKH